MSLHWIKQPFTFSHLSRTVCLNLIKACCTVWVQSIGQNLYLGSDFAKGLVLASCDVMSRNVTSHMSRIVSCARQKRLGRKADISVVYFQRVSTEMV